MQQTKHARYPRVMHSQARLCSLLIIICLFLAALLRAQENPLNDPDLKEMLKQAQEMQKKANPTSADPKKKLAEMLSQAKEEGARQAQEEKREKEKLQAALKKQLEAPGPVALPEWTPVTPQFKAGGSATKRIVDDQVRIVQTGSSSLSLQELADSCEAAAVAAKNLNHGRNNIEVNGKMTTITFLSTRTGPVQEVKLEASREPGDKITLVEISSPLTQPEIESE